MKHPISKGMRIHHRKRVIAKRRFYWSRDLRKDTKRISGIVSKTPKPCSCWMCGNPRKYGIERLGKDFEKILFDNLNDLYEE